MKHLLTLIMILIVSSVNAQSKLKIGQVKVIKRDTIISLADSSLSLKLCELIMERGVITLAVAKYVNKPVMYQVVVKIYTGISTNNEDYGLGIYTKKKVNDCGKSFVLPINSHVTTEIGGGDLHKILVVMDKVQFESLYHVYRVDLVTKNKLYVFELEKEERKRIKLVHKSIMK
jgi:hypothetical protein